MMSYGLGPNLTGLCVALEEEEVREIVHPLSLPLRTQREGNHLASQERSFNKNVPELAP